MNQSFGNYQLVKKLATGGMAEVWLAKQTGIEGFNRHVVVKRILPHLAEDPEFVQMFLNEAKIASRFNHPNIAQIYDLGEKDGQYFIAMEFIHGEDLGRVMRRAWSTGQWVARHIALRIVADSCQGLYYAHTRNDEQGRPLRVVHRDISPQNILISFDGAVKVVDFGIAKASDQVSMTKSGAIKGKFAYMAPEQAAGKPLDARSDVFALGLVLYELVTGVRPLKRDSELATLQAALECKIDPPSAVAEVPVELDEIVMRALAKAPDDRYTDAREFQRSLEQFLLHSKELSTSAEVSELMAALFADRLGEEARLGAPNPSTESSTSNPIPPSYSGAPSVTQPPPKPASRPPPPPPASRTQDHVRASPSLTLDEDALAEELPPEDEESVELRGGYELPAGTVVPSRRYSAGQPRRAEATTAARPSRPEVARSDMTAEELPPARSQPKRRNTGMATPVSDEDLEPRRRPTGQLKRRTSSSTAMPEAPPRRSRSGVPASDDGAQRPSADGISKLVDVRELKARQASRLKALVAVLVLIGMLGVVFVYREQLGSLLKSNGLAEDGVPLRLTVMTNPPTEVTIVPGPNARGRRPLDLGRTPIEATSGAFAGDTVVLLNRDRFLRWEETLNYGEPNSVQKIDKTFKESGVTFRVKPKLKDVTIWRGPLKIGQANMPISMFPGIHKLEVHSDALEEPFEFDVTFTEGAANIDWPVDVTPNLKKK
ncbi:MAG: serine/threonine protein kinase [Archangium sp.]